MKIEYDTPIEVTEKQYAILMNRMSGIICGRHESGRYFIKLWYMRYAEHLAKFLQQC